MRQKRQLSWQQGLVILGLIWLMGAIGDRLWYALDHSVPAWDQADYLNGVLNYWAALQHPQWLDSSWWRSFWLLSNKIPPLNYILTAPIVELFGTTEDAAAMIMLFYSSVLLVSVYGLGIVLFDVTTGIWAAGLCQLIPGLYYHRLEFILDYPLTTAVTFSFWLLTVYFFHNKNDLRGWILGILWGISFGLSILMKQTALFFLFFPLVAILFTFVRRCDWLRLIQFISSLAVGVAVAFPWYRTNWLLILTSGKRATVDSAIAEGDPALNTIGAWTYYGKILPYLLSWHLLLIPLVGFLLYFGRKYLAQRSSHSRYFSRSQWSWLAVFLLGGYFLSSLNINKDARYILPLLPVLSIVLTVGLLSWRSRWQNYILGITASLGIILLLLNIFPLGGEFIATKLSPRTQHYPYTGKPYPHPEVIAEISQTSPYLRTVLGVLPSTPTINQHNFSFYGKQNKAQVSGRQVGVRESEILPDSRSLDWFVTKTGDQGSIPESQPAIVELIETGKEFNLQKSWQLPDDSQLKLYHRDLPLVEVNKLAEPLSDQQSLILKQVEIPAVAPPGVPIPVTYYWQGDRQLLESGIVLLTWRSEADAQFWLHDHGIGMGGLSFPPSVDSNFEVIERTAMLPPPDIPPGKYILQAIYLDRQTGKTKPLSLSPTSITIDPQASAIPASELDLVSQLRNIAPKMAENIQGLEPIFAQTARINQYDAQQDYLQQAELALSYRLQQNQVSRLQKRNWLYAVALSQVLQQDVTGAIASFRQITQLEPQNPYGYAYLAFVHLYDWQPKPAELALGTATQINPDVTEFKTLQGVAAIMRGRLIKAWKLIIN